MIVDSSVGVGIFCSFFGNLEVSVGRNEVRSFFFILFYALERDSVG